MMPSSSNRSLVAWALYFCVLFNVFSCGLVHGQTVGLNLNGIGGAFCSLGSDIGGLQGKDLLTPKADEWSGKASCPLCSASFLALVFLLAVAWLLGRANLRPPRPAVSFRVTPRYCWPSANPRASPQGSA